MNSIPATQKEAVKIRRAFAMILKADQKMQSTKDDKRYQIADVVKKGIADLLTLDFTVLSKSELLKLCGLVQSYRPVSLHVFLNKCDQLL